MCSINQSNSSISVRLLFLYCAPVFISRSYQNRSMSILEKGEVIWSILENVRLNVWRKWIFHREFVSILLQDITVSPKIFDEIKEIEKEKGVTIITGGIGGYKRPKVQFYSQFSCLLLEVFCSKFLLGIVPQVRMSIKLHG